MPFTTVLSEATIAPVLESLIGLWKDRVYSPLVTLWVFLSQMLSADHSCRAAVARLIAHRVPQGQLPCSVNTGAYCQARQRLRERFFSAVACLVGRALDAQADERWLWKGRRVYLFDGTTVAMRGKTPALVHKEIWTHALAYNLIRTIMAQAATTHELLPRSISFKGAVQTLEAFQPVIELQAARGAAHRLQLYQDFLKRLQLIAWRTALTALSLA